MKHIMKCEMINIDNALQITNVERCQMIRLKNTEEINLLRQANQLVGNLLQELAKQVRPGVSTMDLDCFAEDYIRSHGAIPSFKGYHGYPNSICASVNNVVVHGIPSADQRLKVGDIISIDAGAKLNGYVGDSTITVPVGDIDPKLARLMQVTQEALELGIGQARVGNRIGDIGYVMQKHVEEQGFSIVRHFIGHGVGTDMHEDPPVPSFGRRGTGSLIKEGLVIAIEPIVNVGDYDVDVLADGWTAVTKDGSYSAQFEHTVAITAAGAEILSKVI